MERLIKDCSAELIADFRMDRKAFERACGEIGLKAVSGGEEKVLRFVASTEVQDRHREVVLTKGWDLKGYKKNPVVLWNHGWNDPPIGSAIQIEKNLTAKRLEATFLYAEEEFALAATVAALARKGFIRATSVGFKPNKAGLWVEDKDEQAKYGMTTPGTVYASQELLEISNVSVPANAEALRLAYGSGGEEIVSKAFGIQEADVEKTLRDAGVVTRPVFITEGIAPPLEEGTPEEPAMEVKALEFVRRILKRLATREADGSVAIDSTMADAWMEQAKAIAPEAETDTDPVDALADAVFDRIVKKIEDNGDFIAKAGAVLNRQNRERLNKVHKTLGTCHAEMGELLAVANAMDDEEEKPEGEPEKSADPMFSEESLDVVSKALADIYAVTEETAKQFAETK